MTVDVCKLKEKFTDELSDLYNQDVYLIGNCSKFPSKQSLQQDLFDLSLKIYFEENNKIVLAGKMVKYCDKDGHKRKIKLKDISSELNQPEVNITKNYIVDDKWDKIEW